MTAAYDHPPLDPSFISGERTIGVSDPINAASNVTYNIARFLELPHGVYNIRWLAYGDSLLRVGKDASSLETAFQVLSGSIVETQIYLEGGEIRFDIELQGQAGSTTGVIFVIYNSTDVIYTSNAQGWQFDTTALPDAALTPGDDPRLQLPVWSVLPNWRDGITEFVEYLTDVSVSETGNTITRTLREAPRRYFEFDFMRHGVNRTRLDNMLLGIGKGELLLPLWHEQHRPIGGIAQGQTDILFSDDSLQQREFRADDLIIVTLGEPGNYELLTVQSIQSDRIVLAAGPQQSWPSGCRIAPMRVATISESNNLSNITDRVATGRVRFKIEEREEGFGEFFGYCGSVWRFPVDWSSTVDIGHERLSFTFDNMTALPFTVDPGQRATVLTRARSLIRGRSEMVRLRRFIQAARGRARRFWLPSFTMDIEPVSGIGGKTFSIKKTGFPEYARTIQSARMFIAVLFADGSPTIYREVTSYGELSDTDVVEVDWNLPEVPVSDIERIQFILPARFDQDRFEFKHLTDDSAVVQVGFTFRSADHDGMVLPNCGFTTAPYPLVESDRISVYGSFVGARFGGIPDITEALDVSASFVQASYPISVVYSAMTLDVESLDVSASFVSAAYPQTVQYGTYEAGLESLDVSASFVQASYPQTVNYITYDIDVESLSVSASFVGASLS